MNNVAGPTIASQPQHHLALLFGKLFTRQLYLPGYRPAADCEQKVRGAEVVAGLLVHPGSNCYDVPKTKQPVNLVLQFLFSFNFKLAWCRRIRLEQHLTERSLIEYMLVLSLEFLTGVRELDHATG